MKRKLVLAMALAGMFFLGGISQRASAQGFHYQSRGLHVDVGNPHSAFYGGGFYGGYARSYPTYWGAGYNSGYGGGYYGDDAHVWHDTTHLDYHPAEIVPHYGHYHYVPGHYDVHQTGHWDHLHD